MAIRNIVKEGDPILNKVCRPVTTFDDRLATLLDDMHETMIAADGVGLAGPQVGMLRRLFVVWDTTDAPEEIPEDYEYKFIDFVNPEILAVSEEEETAYEGCLSFPGHNGAVTRPAAVKVRAQDRHGEWFELEAENLLGRCIQHENDHLDGITIMQSSEYFYEDTEEGKKSCPRSERKQVMRILFMGTPDIAAECLKALYAAGHDICAVYTRRDKPVGRKQVLTAPPVKEVALAHGTPVFQPRTLRDGSEDENIRALAPELIVVVAYGCILPKSVLEAPKYGCINLHVSLLPKYRGSAPVQWAVLNGDAETGVSIMQMDEGLDTGDVLCCEKIAIDPEETSGQLFDRVTAVGARVLCEVVPAIAAGTLKPQPQDHENACLAPMLNKEMAEFRLTESAAHIHNWVRGMNPWPGAWFVTSGGKKLKVMECRAVEAHGEAPGTVLATKPLTVSCGEGAVQLLNVVPEGKKPMDGTAFAAGQRLKTGDIL